MMTRETTLGSLKNLTKGIVLVSVLTLIGCGGAADSVDGSGETVVVIPSDDGLISVALATSHGVNTETHDGQSRYFVHYSAQVTDFRTGAPLRNRQVDIATAPVVAGQGRWAFFEETTDPVTMATIKAHWGQITTGTCTPVDSLDNRFETGVAITKEDDPTPQNSFATDGQGKLSFDVRYGRNYATWVDYDLVVTSGTSAVKFREVLWFLASDLDEAGKTSPSFSNSPFNGRAGCVSAS